MANGLHFEKWKIGHRTISINAKACSCQKCHFLYLSERPLQQSCTTVQTVILTALTKTLMSVQPLVGYVSHSASVGASVCWCLSLSKHQAAGSGHVGSANTSKSWCLAPPGDQRSWLFLVVKRPLKLTNDAIWGSSLWLISTFRLCRSLLMAVHSLHVLSLCQPYFYYKNKTGFSFSSL